MSRDTFEKEIGWIHSEKIAKFATYCVFPNLSPFTVIVLSSLAVPVFSGNEKYAINVFPGLATVFSFVVFSSFGSGTPDSGWFWRKDRAA